MKKVIDFIGSNLRQIFETIALIFMTALPWLVNLQELFNGHLENNPPTPDHFWLYIALTYGKPVASIVFLAIVLSSFGKINTNYVMNAMYVYHNYCYAWYWFCAKVLRIKKCNLVLVPIHMQFKLVIRGTFKDYPLQDDDYPIIDNESEIRVSTTHTDADKGTINFVLEDTYPIEERQLRKNNRELFTIKISRNDGSNCQHFSSKFVDAISKALKEYRRIEVVNVYSTTNPKNTLYIARRVFGSVDRGNIRHLYVFQQNKTGSRMFERKGHKIF